MKKETKIGTYRKNQKGFGFVKLEGQEDEIYIAKEHSLNALNGDVVSIEIIAPQDKEAAKRLAEEEKAKRKAEREKKNNPMYKLGKKAVNMGTTRILSKFFSALFKSGKK